MELEEAIERLKRGIEDTMFSTLYSQEQEEKDIKTVLKELERYRNGEIISLKVLEDYYLVSKNKERQMTLANKELFREYVPKEIADKQKKMIELMAIKIKKQISCYDPCWLEYEDDNIKCYGQEECKECIKQYFEKKAEESE